MSRLPTSRDLVSLITTSGQHHAVRVKLLRAPDFEPPIQFINRFSVEVVGVNSKGLRA